MQNIVITRENLEELNIFQLREIGRAIGVFSPTTLRRNDLIDKIISISSGESKPIPRTNRGRPTKPSINNMVVKTATGEALTVDSKLWNGESDGNIIREDIDVEEFINNETESEIKEGVLEINPNGYGFARNEQFNISRDDIYLTPQQIKTMRLKNGDLVKGKVSRRKDSGYDLMYYVTGVNGKSVDESMHRIDFDDLVPLYPEERLKMEIEGEENLSQRLIDLISPIGKGQRALVVSPPKAGKTTILKSIAKSIKTNNREVKLLVLLIDERPEEVTDIKRSVDGEIVYSTFDESIEHHIKAAEYTLNRAKRMVEAGEDVVILLDSITRLSRSYNTYCPSSGKTLSGGLDPNSLAFPKKFFGAARNIENGGSMTVIATCLIDTGSRLDDIIYEEFKGTGNMEIHLSRDLSERRIFPAIDIYKSGTRRDDLLLSKEELNCVNLMRRVLDTDNRNDAIIGLIDMMEKTKTNSEFVMKFPEWTKIAKR